jgi:hypothetical protein
LFLVEAPQNFIDGVVKTAASMTETFCNEDTRPSTLNTILWLNIADLRSHGVLVVVLMEAPFDVINGVIKAALWMTQADFPRYARPTTLHTVIRVHCADCLTVLSALVTPYFILNGVVKTASNSCQTRLR